MAAVMSKEKYRDKDKDKEKDKDKDNDNNKDKDKALHIRRPRCPKLAAVMSRENS